MRSGYPDEETGQEYMDALYWGVYHHSLRNFRLFVKPATIFNSQTI